MDGLEFQLFAKLGIVLLLVFPALWALRRWLGAPQGAGWRKVIHVVETQTLGEGQRLYLVRIQGRHLLLGGCKESLNVLAEMDDLEIPTAQPAPQAIPWDQATRLLGALGARRPTWLAGRPAAERSELQ